MKQGTISSITHEGQWTNKYGTFDKYKVTFEEESNAFYFNAKGDFSKSVGDVVEFQVTDHTHNAAKLHYPKPQEFKPQASGSQQRSADTQTQIVRQSMLKAAIDHHAGHGLPSDLSAVKTTAKELINFIYTGE